MKTANAMQLKARIKAKAMETNLSPQLLMQEYMLERLLERLSLSPWRDRMVVKGGMLIASLVGADGRVTKDLDVTAQGFALTEGTLEEALREIVSIEVDDDVTFELLRTEAIRIDDEYPGVRACLRAQYPPMSVALSMDVTTGDAITPSAVVYEYPLMFENRSVPLLVYPLATSFSEKLETVVSRGTANTRLRDYYDLLVLWKARRHEIDQPLLRKALLATAERRGSIEAVLAWRSTMSAIAEDEVMKSRWSSYVSAYRYARGMELGEAIEAICEIMSLLEPF